MRLAAASCTTDARLTKCFHSLSLSEDELMQSYGIHRNVSTLCLHRMSLYMSQCFVTPSNIRYEESIVVRFKSNLLLMIFWLHIINYNS